MNILTEDALKDLFIWLGEQLKSALGRQSWETFVQSFPYDEGGATLYLFPTSWRIPGVDD
jgi:hypothetical protein